MICLNTCNGRQDEAYCQIRCGDLFENDAVGKFNACAVSKKNCVKQRQVRDHDKFQSPAVCQGTWWGRLLPCMFFTRF